jgi:hypothetical protein
MTENVLDRIVVELPKDRSQRGKFYFLNSKGKILDSFPALGLYPAFAALMRGNRDRNPLRPHGNMPLGDYEVVAIYPTGA